MEGLESAIDLIQSTAVKAAGAEVLSGTGLRNRSFTHNNGVLEKYDHDAPARQHSHAEFVRWLVQNLRDEFDAAAPGLLGTIRNLKFLTADAQTGNIQQGRESMGRTIDKEITGAKDLPETVTINVRR